MPSEISFSGEHRLFLSILLIVFVSGILLFSPTTLTGAVVAKQLAKPQIQATDKIAPQVSVSFSPLKPKVGQKVTFLVIARDSTALSRIDLYVGETLVKTCKISSKSFSACGYSNKYSIKEAHTVRATATDAAGNLGKSTERTFTVG